MKIKKEYIGGKVYSKSLGRLILICEENIEIFKKDNLNHLYVTTKTKRSKQDSVIVEPISDNSES
jgi:hypothetical protein|tara:strand:- start:94 stop:288 length:195 start_codon:yes stop_codon:yes gene_type:complete